MVRGFRGCAAPRCRSVAPASTDTLQLRYGEAPGNRRRVPRIIRVGAALSFCGEDLAISCSRSIQFQVPHKYRDLCRTAYFSRRQLEEVPAMSGFEIAGLVLGAFPLAILALEKHREVATRLGLFYKIKLEHKKCMDDLVYQQLYLKRHLRKLILPLKVNYDDAKINELLADPDGPGWKDATVSAMFEERLQDSYELYLSYIQSIKETMDRLNHELAADSDTIQDQVQPSASKTRVRSKESRQFQRYRIKFSNGEAVRNRLFSDLQEYNAKLEQLLESSDKDASLVRQTTGARTTVMDATLCTFWIQAAKVFRALVTAWTCQCRQQHCAKLQLQHRTTRKKPEFNILFETEGLEPLPWEKRRAKISEGADQVAAMFETRTAVVPQRSLPLRGPSPTPRTAPPPKSALKAQGPKKSSAVGFLV
jgi:hypothetical protein